MKKTTLRKTLIAMLAAAMCATGAVIPTSARGDYCNVNGQFFVHKSHGSMSVVDDPAYCYYYNYYQCIEECYYCGTTRMTNCTVSQMHSYIYKNINGTLVRMCDLCGEVFG